MKKLIRNILHRFGYDIIKTEDWYTSKSRQKRIVRVGDYQIAMPGNNTLLRTYNLYPDFNSLIGRLALVVAKKYPGMTVIDIGANAGDTIAIIKSVIDIPVIGIEGDEISFQYLQENTKPFKDVTIIKAFVGEREQEIKAELVHGGTNTTIVPSEKGSKSISFRTVDELLCEQRFANSNVKLIKLDIEGFDTIALRGSYGVIKKFQPVLFFEYNPENMKIIHEDGLSTLLSFRAYGYNRIAYFDHKGRMLLVTSLQNMVEMACLHTYALDKNNLLGHYDICIFHQQDEMPANEFLKAEEEYTAGYSSSD
ncbi:MAG: FkbM family methyltransferase [Chitinophagaceae bacterium]|nr:FkbM family methyltransferase [Chitinophagaceae bacterium]